MINATPKKLRNGNWGALAKTEKVSDGDTVRITTKSGKTWTSQVVKVLWRGDGVAICATSKRDERRSGSTSRPRRRSGCCQARGCRNSATLDAPRHAAMGGYCGYCAFDEFDC